MKKLLCLIPAVAVISCIGDSGSSTTGPLFVYIGNFDYNAPVSTLTECTVNPTNGNFTNCLAIRPRTSDGANALLNPTGMTRYTTAGRTYMYINNLGDASTANGGNSRCILTSSGTLVNCQTIVSGGGNTFSWPIGVKINNGYAYIPNYGSSTVNGNDYTKCNVDPINGSLSSCANIIPKDSLGSNVLYTPEDIAIYRTTTGSFVAYIPNQKNNSYAQCNINSSTGVLEGCTRNVPAAPGELKEPRGVTINNGFIYFANSSDGDNPATKSGYTQCAINPVNGNLSNCNTTVLANILNSPTGIVIKDVGNNRYAYIANEKGKNYTPCNVDKTNGTLSNCSNPTAGGFFPTSTALTYIEFSR